jgi:protein gp37
MGDRSVISWCHCTFNPWWGCIEVSPACDHCYARELAKRYGHAVWGKDAPRRFFGDAHWDEPMRWNRRAEKAGERYRVFCASMADIGEERSDVVGRQMDEARRRLWFVIANTPQLDWLLLTKRPQFYRRVPEEIRSLPNVWPGTTVESAEYLWRADELMRAPWWEGPRWISAEPLLGPLDLRPDLAGCGWPEGSRRALRWVIAGCESRAGYRPGRLTNEAWVRDIRDQCQATGTAFFLKQAIVDGRVVQTPELDGRQWMEFPR